MGKLYLMFTKSRYTFRLLFLMVVMLIAGKSWGQYSYTTIGSLYTQNFDNLSSTAAPSSDVTGGSLTNVNGSLNGWYFLETGSSANLKYTASDGTSNSGDTYSFGATSASDRALGGILSGNVISKIGFYFTNNTGVTITSLDIAYTGEQWRLGATGRVDRLDFQYSVDASSLSSGAWTDVDALDFTAPINSGTVGKLDGNLSANKASISNSITGLSIANGSKIFIRWNDFDATGSDDGLGVDDFSIKANAAVSHTVSFNANGGTGTMANQTASSATALTTNAFTRTGYTFDGWATTAGGAVAYTDGASYPFTADATLYAHWTVIPIVDYCNLQFPGTATITLPGTATIYAQVYKAGLTDITSGQAPGITAWIGYSSSNTNPNDAGWTWVPATFNIESGNNDEYKADIGGGLAPGTYYYASRFQLGAGPYRYGGFSGGFWDGSTNISGVLTINDNQVDYCNIQAPGTGAILQGSKFEIYAQVYEAGVTPGAGSQGANIQAWIGYNTTNANPNAAGWTWLPASFNAGGGGVNNDEYMVDMGATLASVGSGTYYYASRFQIGAGSYSYGGYSGSGGNFWDGSSNISGVLTIAKVSGNGNDVVYGSTTTSTTNNTNFGTTCIGIPVVNTFTIANASTTNTVSFGSVSITGPNAADFSITTVPVSPIAASGSTNLQISFSPTGSGAKVATVNIATDLNTYSFTISGTGNIVTSIGTNPTSQSIASLSPVTFTVAATGTSLTYQWQENGVNLTNGGIYSGVLTNTLNISTVNATMNGNQYKCIVTGTCGSLTSAVATLTVTGNAIWTNPITGTNPNLSNPYTAGQLYDPNITVSGIGRGSGISGTNANDRYNASNWSTGAIDLTKYFEFTLTPNCGYQINLLDFKYTGQVSSGTPSFAFRSSLDGFTANIGTPTTGGTTINLSAALYQNLSIPVTFRFYAYNLAASGTTYSINDFTFDGTVTQPGLSTLGINNAGTPTAGTINLGSSNVVLSAFNLNATASQTFSAVTIKAIGTAVGTGTDINNVRIFWDQNANGIIDGADASVSGAGVVLIASMPFTITGQTFSCNRHYLVVADVLSGATIGRTVTTSINAATDVTTTISKTGTAPGNPQTIGFTSLANDYFKSNVPSGNWNTPASWLSSRDNVNFYPATLSPGASALGVNILTGNTINITTSVSINNTVINGKVAMLNDPATNAGRITLIDNGAANEMTINSGGIFQVVSSNESYGTAVTYNTNGNILVNKGGVISIGDGATGLTASDYSFFGTETSAKVAWSDSAIFEWNSTGVESLATSSVTYFPSNSTSVKSIVRVVKTMGGTWGAGGTNPTVINGILEIDADNTLKQGGAKTIRDGITGTATLTLDAGLGTTTLSGNTAIIGGTGLNIVMNKPLNVTNGFTVPAGKDAKISSTNSSGISKGSSGVITVNGILDITDVSITNTSGSVQVNGTLKTSNTSGLYNPGNIASGTIALNTGSVVEYNATVNQAITSTTVLGQPYLGLIVSNGGTKKPSSAITANDFLKITGATTTLDATLNNISGTGKLVMDGGLFIIGTGGTQPALTGGPYALTGGTIDFVGTSAQSINNETYQNILVHNNNCGNTDDIKLNANGTFIIKSGGILNINSGSVKAASATTGQTFTIETGGLLKCGNEKGFSGYTETYFPTLSSSIDASISNIILQTGSIVDYSRATPAQVSGDQVITNTIPYQNFTISGNGTKTAPSGTLAIQGDFTKTGTATFAHNNGTVSFNGSSVQTYSNTAAPIVTFYNLTNNNTAGLKINSDSLALENQLLLNTGSKLTLNTGDIILKSRDLFTANVAAVAGTINYAGTGRFITERYINNAGHTKAWQFLSVPVNSTQSIKDAYQEGGSLGSNPKSGFGTQLTSPLGTAAGFDGSSLGPSIKTYISATDFWDAGPSNTSNSINNAKGWMIFIRGDRSLAPSFTGSGSSSTIMRSRGQLYTGNQGPYGVANGKFESVGNPYASAIDLRQTTRTNLTNEIYIWDPTLSGAFGVGGYRTLTYIGSDFHVVPAGGTYPGPISNNIQSGQAFFIKGASSGTASISLSENSKVGGSALVNGSPVANPAAMLSVNVSAKVPGSPSVLLDGDMAIFDKGYADEVDEQDGIKLKNSGENLGLRRDHYLLSVERRSLPKPNDTLNLEISGFKQKDYEFEFNTSAFNLPGVQAILWDSYTKTFTPLSGASSKVDFTVDGNAGSSSANRFKIVFSSTAAGPLPVTLTGIKAIRNADGSITVNWQSTNEINIEGYGIERSGNSSSFEGIGNQQALNNNGGSSDYTFIDNAPLNADNYYRIKAIGKDGKIQYSPIAKVAWLKHAPAISVYPNPLAGRDMQVVFASQPLGRYKLLMTNKEGQVVYTGTVNVSSSNFVKTIKLRPGLAAGSYQLTVSDINGNPVAMQVILL